MEEDSRTPTAQALAEYIVSLPELLANVLEHLDQRTLLCSAQRVCHAWRHLVTTTPSIQRRLFFSPLDHSRAQYQRSTSRLNPILGEIFRPLFEERNSAAHPAFNSVFGISIDRAAGSSGGKGKGGRSSNPPPPVPPKHDRLLRPDASWRRMLTQQPPVYHLGVWSERQGGSRPPLAAAASQPQEVPYRVLDFPRGLRMGELYELCLGTAGDPVLSFRPYWDVNRPEIVQAVNYAGEPLFAPKINSAYRLLVDTLRAEAAASAARADSDGNAEEVQRDEPLADAVIRLYRLAHLGRIVQAARKQYAESMNYFRLRAASEAVNANTSGGIVVAGVH